MTDYKPVPIFATPESPEALNKYVDLFKIDDEISAAKLGYSLFKDHTELQVQLDKLEEEIKPSSELIAYTVAGMRWNLFCKEMNSLD